MFLGRCFDNGWLANRFWRSVNIEVDTETKIGASDEDVNLLLSVLDLFKLSSANSKTSVYGEGTTKSAAAIIEIKDKK
ncbi:hypothetical protein [Paenisporosarcina antarctica]|uniref:hypothetical protein n=1 Tax=Paenisporosarcina antarctica TaxID=417367 RepID=UPI00141709CA|nr:hypothetical protein [Paenisporosarcina antarctica]